MKGLNGWEDILFLLHSGPAQNAESQVVQTTVLELTTCMVLWGHLNLHRLIVFIVDDCQSSALSLFQVRQVGLKAVLTQQAYLLFYSKVSKEEPKV